MEFHNKPFLKWPGGKFKLAKRIAAKLDLCTERLVEPFVGSGAVFLTYDVLDTSAFKHLRINHSLLFAEGRNHINGIENFWNQAKPHMRKFNGVPKQNFYLFLKECEWRFNGGSHQDLLSQLKCWYKSAKH